jgi:basic amino acid/polyamine antiporter, APA family
MRRSEPRLARAWSARDAFVYAFFSVNAVMLGLYIMSQAWGFAGGMLPALALGAALVLTEVLAYSFMTAAMTRSGGDYAWQSAVLGRGIGFTLAITGWCFILWLWTPIYGDILRQAVLAPLASALGLGRTALVLATSRSAWFAVCAAMCALVLILVARGMESYARLQRASFWIGNAALAAVIVLLLSIDRGGYRAAFDAEAPRLLGALGGYDAVVAAGEAAGASTPLAGGSLGQVLLLLPCLAFWNLWPNCGSSLAGEVRGAHRIGVNLKAMGGALLASTALLAALALAIDRAMGWRFYMDANAAYWSARNAPGGGSAALPMWPYPVLLALVAVKGTWFRVALIAAMSAWFVGWAGTIFLSSSRIVLSAAFDRLLPAGLGRVDARTRSPFKALLFMAVPSLGVSALYAWDVFGFASLTLASTAVIAITFLGTGVAAVLLPLRRRALYRASPLARYRLGPVPLVSIAGLAFSAFLGFLLFEWLADPGDLYGISYRNATSMAFMLALYAVALVLYLILSRRGEGEAGELDEAFEEGPADR